MENRLEILRRKVDELVDLVQRDKQRYFFVHLYGVSHFGAILAIRRGLDPELASACGMLHDIYAVISGSYDNHAIIGSIEAKKILESINLFTNSEIDIITTAISRHSDKDKKHLPYDEILKDADVLHHCLYNPSFPVKEYEQSRYSNILIELGANTAGLIG
ncbi:MAG: HD domain-containing protein [Clostridiaceae bacterium]